MKQNLENKFFLLLLGLITAAFLLLLLPYWGAIFWAVALTVLFYPMYAWFNQKLGSKPTLASITTVSVAFLLVVIPIALLTLHIVNSANDLYQSFDTGDLDAEVVRENIEERFPFIPQTLERFNIDTENLGERLAGSISSTSQFIAQEAFSIGKGIMGFLISAAVMLYLAFFFFRDGEKIADITAKAIPLGKNRENMLASRFILVTRATIKSTFIVAIVEGGLGAIILALLGIPGAVLWGIVIAFLSLIPAIGAFIVWGPIAIYLLTTGDIFKGVVLIVYGSVIIGLADNVLRPLLVGRDVRLPDWLILLSILGGLVLFGVHGFIIGPILTALFVTFWNIFMHDFDTKES